MNRKLSTYLEKQRQADQQEAERIRETRDAFHRWLLKGAPIALPLSKGRKIRRCR